MTAHYLPYKDTNSFSQLVVDYLEDKQFLREFYSFRPDREGLRQSVEARQNTAIDRYRLVKSLRSQYEGLDLHPHVRENIDLLGSKDTFTVCTAHQPNLMTGYLYFFYKIIHAIRLAKELSGQYPGKHFVPVFYIGSEDDDFEELSVFRFRDELYRWETKQSGAVGRMGTRELIPLLERLKQALGTGAHAEYLRQAITTAYEGCPTVAAAIRCLLNELLGEYGLVVLDADRRELKEGFKPILKQELFAPQAYRLVNETNERLGTRYSAQAYCRPINLFYLLEDSRARIEQSSKDSWRTSDGKTEWSKGELLKELDEYPERFSPNVILRGLYQETILPNVAFIGGGSELAYWMQLRALFHHYQVFYPCLILRQSVLWLNAHEVRLQTKLGLSDRQLFSDVNQLGKTMLVEGNALLSLEDEKKAVAALFQSIVSKAKQIDPTLTSSAEAALTKMRRQVEIVEKKMIRAEKKKELSEFQQLQTLRRHLFPNEQLQERRDSFLAYYLAYGDDFFTSLYRYTRPYGDQFLLLKEDSRKA